MELEGMALLHSALPLLREAVVAIEREGVAQSPAPLASCEQLEERLKEARRALPALLEDELLSQMKLIEAFQLVAELKSYSNLSDEWVKVVAAVLCMAGGKTRAELKEWEAVRRHLKVSLIHSDLRAVR